MKAGSCSNLKNKFHRKIHQCYLLLGSSLLQGKVAGLSGLNNQICNALGYDTENVRGTHWSQNMNNQMTVST